MSREKLTDFEVGIIKNLISRKLENREIAGMINYVRGHPKRHISPARVTDIKKGTTLCYKPVPVATDAVTNKFIEDYNKDFLEGTGPLAPLDPVVVEQNFPLNKQGTHFVITETDSIECKQSINIPIKTVAGLANNKGGYVVLGVRDGDWEIVGIEKEKLKKFDFNVWNQKIRDYLNIGIELQKVERDYDGKTVLFIHVGAAHTKPVITVKNGDGVKDGTIYYRYPGEDRPITSSDLQRLIEDRLKQLSQTVFNKHIKKIIEIGPSNAAVLDLNSGEMEGKSGSVILDEETLKKISFIKEGEFVEKGGKPTLKLIGEVSEYASTIVQEKDVLQLYPISGKEFMKRVKKQIPDAKEPIIYKLLKECGIRDDPEFSTYPFRSTSQRKQYEDKGVIPSGMSPIYNEKAVKAIVEKLNTKNN